MKLDLYAWFALFIVIMDISLLGLNVVKLRYHAHWSVIRLVIGLLLAMLLTWQFLVRTQQSWLVALAFVLTALLFAGVRKGLGKKYALVSLSMNGLKDYRQFKTYHIEKIDDQHCQLTLIDYGQHRFTLTFASPEVDIANWLSTKLTTSN